MCTVYVCTISLFLWNYRYVKALLNDRNITVMYPETLSRLLNLLERLNGRGLLSDFEALHLNLARGNWFISFIYLFLLAVRAVIWWMISDILNFAVCWVLLQPCLWWMASYCRVGWLFSHLNLPWSSRYFNVANSALPLCFRCVI